MTFYRKFIWFILIYLLSNNKSVLVQSADTSNEPGSATEGGQKPQNSATELDPSNYPQDIKLFKADPNDANNTVEIPTSEYKVKKDGDDHVYEFNQGVNCTMLMHNNKDVWKFDSSKANSKYPKRVEALTENLDEEEQAILIIFDGYTEIYDKDGDNWFLCATVKRELNKVQTGGKRADGTSGGGGTDQSSHGSVATHTGAENADSKSQVTTPSAGGDASSTVAEPVAEGTAPAAPEAPDSSIASPGSGHVAGGSGESGESGEAKSGDSSSTEETSESTDSGLDSGKVGDDANVSSVVTSSGPDADVNSGLASVVAGPGFVACAESGSVTGVPNVDWTVGVSAGRPKQGLASGGANQPVDPAKELKLFKDDPEGNPLQITTTEFFQDRYRGHLTYVLKKGVMCTLVRFGDKDVWKKGVENVQEPKSVTYDPFMMELAVRDANNSVHFGMDSKTRDWKHVVTYKRGKRMAATKRSEITPRPRPQSYRLPLPKSIFGTSDLSWTMPVTKTASTTPPKQAEPSQEPLKASEKADQASTVPSGTPEAHSESGSSSALRGTTGTAEGSGESEDSARASSGGDGATEQAQESSKEDQKDGEKEASAKADGSTGSASEDAGWTAGGSSEDAGSTAGGDSGTGAGQVSESTDQGLASGEAAKSGSSGEDGEAKSPDGGSSGAEAPAEGSGTTAGGQDSSGGGWTSGTDQDGTSSSPTTGGSTTHTGGGDGSGTGADGTSTSADGSASGAGTEADGSSQPSSGAPSSGGTEKSGPDGSPSGTPERRGSSATPPASSGGDDTSGTPGQDSSTTPTGTSTEDGDTDTGTKTGVELSLKATKATDQFDYEKIDTVVTFTVKHNYAFSVVKEGSTEIWKTDKETEYAIKVVYNNKSQSKKEVTIYFPDNTNKSYKKDGWFKPWREVAPLSDQTDGTKSPSSSGQSGGSPATTPGSTNENTATVDIDKSVATEYIGDIDGSRITFNPRTGYSFNIVKQGSTEIWKASKEDEYSKKVVSDFVKNVVTIHIGSEGNSKKLFKKGSDNNWKEENQNSTQQSVTNSSGGGTTQTTQTSGGTTCMDASGETAESNVGESGSSIIETSESTGSGLEYSLIYGEGSTFSGSSETANGSSGRLSGFGFGGSSSKSKKKESKQQSGSTSSGSLGLSSLTGIFSRSSGGSSKTSKSSDADVSSGLTTGEASDNLTTNGGLVAGYGSTGGGSRGSDPSKDVASNHSIKEAVETLQSEENEKDSEEEATNGEGNDNDGKDEEDSCKKEKEDNAEEENEEAASEDENEETEESSLHITAKSSEPTDPGSIALTSGGAYFDVSGASSTSAYGASATPGQGATSTPTASGTDSGTKTGIDLSLKSTAATDQFDYNKVGNVVTFTAKDKYAFNVVKQGDKEIWKTEKQNDYATKVVLYGKGKKDKIVTIHLPNGTKKSYKKDKNNPWTEYNGPLPSTGNAKSSGGSEFELNIKKDGKQSAEGRSADGSSAEGRSSDGRSGGEKTSQEPSSEGQSAEGGSTTPKPSRDQSAEKGSDPSKSSGGSGDDSDNENFKLTVHNKYLTYSIKSGKNCRLVKVEDKEVWKYDPTKFDGQHPTNIWCENYEKLYVGFGQKYETYEKGSDGNWNEMKNT